MKHDQKTTKHILPFLSLNYDEITVFLLTLTILLFSVISAQFREFETQLFNLEWPLGWILSIIAVSGIVLSLVHISTTRVKRVWEKYFMLGFAILFTIVAGGKVLIDLLRMGPSTSYSPGFIDWKFALVLLMTWNIGRCVVSLFTLVMSLGGIIHSGYMDITQSNSSLREVIIASTILVSIVLLGQYLFNLHWSVIFSIVLTYALGWQDLRRWLIKH